MSADEGFRRQTALAEAFLMRLENRLGSVARPQDSFFAHQVVTTAVQRLRVDLLEGLRLTPEGELFAAEAAAYLSWIAGHNWRRRRLKLEVLVHVGDGAEDERITVAAWRGDRCYGHDFLADMHERLLQPSEFFGESLALPSPEFLYMRGVCQLDSPAAFGDWECGEEDDVASRLIMIDDLHRDVGLPVGDEELRRLSWDVVAGGDRLLALKPPLEYLRALLTSQCWPVRNVAARALMSLGTPPLTPRERDVYLQAEPGNALALAGPVDAWRASPALHELSQGRRPAEVLAAHPGDWFAQAAAAEAASDERRLRSLLKGALNASAHLALSKLLERGAALLVLEDAIRRWPWDHQLVDACLWRLTEGMTEVI